MNLSENLKVKVKRLKLLKRKKKTWNNLKLVIERQGKNKGKRDQRNLILSNMMKKNF